MKKEPPNINDIKEKLIEKGSEAGAEERVKKTFFDYFKKHKESISFGSQVEKIYNMLTSGKLNKTDKALILGALIYFINPFDLVPDLTPIVGFLDDMTVVGLVYRYLSNRSLDFDDKNSGKNDSNA